MRHRAPDHIMLFVHKLRNQNNHNYIINNGKESYHFVSLKANFFDKNGELAGTDSTYACGNDYIQPKGRKSFEFSGRDPGDYNRVSVELESFR